MNAMTAVQDGPSRPRMVGFHANNGRHAGSRTTTFLTGVEKIPGVPP